MKINWTLKHFKDLTTKELYDIFQLRIEVFVVEQNCPYQDADGKDVKSFHLMGYSPSPSLPKGESENTLVAFARILPQGISYDEVSIGRVVSSPKVRGTGAGKLLMEKCLEEIKTKFGDVPVRIGAQCYLKKFYESFGFVAIGDEYMEDNIPHIIMLR